MIPNLPLAAATALALCSPLALAAETCEQMRDRIEQQARANNVKTPEVLIVTVAEAEAEAETKGRVVGNCGQGRRRIVLRR